MNVIKFFYRDWDMILKNDTPRAKKKNYNWKVIFNIENKILLLLKNIFVQDHAPLSRKYFTKNYKIK